MIFLDRDGVINADSPHYIKSPAEFIFLPRSAAAIRLLTEAGFDVVVITNQSAVGRGMITADTLAAIHARMLEGVRAGGGRIRAIYHCPHAPADGCDCRKPRPGLMLRAARDLGISLADAWMVGDSLTDMQCAEAAGCGHKALVETGNGSAHAGRLAAAGVAVDFVAGDLFEAAERIVGIDFFGGRPVHGNCLNR